MKYLSCKQNENRVAYCLARHAEYIEHVIVWIEKLNFLE